MTSGSTQLDFDRSLIGQQSEPSIIRVATGQLKFFAKATDQRNPIYFDEAAARAAGHRTIPVPPTFAFSLAGACPRQAGFALVRCGVDMRYLLHGEQAFEYHGIVYAEEDVTLTTRILDMYEKKGGALRFIAQRTDVVNEAGTLCIECASTFVIRSPEVQ